MPKNPAPPPQLPKAPTGISGLDEITGGGLPRGRPTLVCGGAGCGKTMLAAEFLICGAMRYDEPGVFMMFEENVEELTANVQSLGFDLTKLQKQKRIFIDHVHVERSEIEETGEYDLQGLFIRLQHAIESVGAKRVVLDTIEALFAGLPNHAVLRAELRRLFRWLKDRGMTAIVTGERGDKSLTRYGLEEYVADCVILLDHRVVDQVSTRRLRVVKYRGSPHGTNEYPFLIGDKGVAVLPITSLRLDHPAPTERVSTGVARLDEMLGGRGVYRGSSVLVSGSPGTGKSSLGASFIDAACKRGERAMLFVYEESAPQVIRNMRSIGIDLIPWVERGLLAIHASRPTLLGLEQHLSTLMRDIEHFQPTVVAIDPISNLTMREDDVSLKPTLMRIIDFLKQGSITAVFTTLTSDTAASVAASQVGVSSLMDAWILLNNLEGNGERTRTLQVLKARGIAHSNQVREFLLSDNGIDLVDVYLQGDRVLTGTARLVHGEQAAEGTELRLQDQQRRIRQLAAQRRAIDAQIATLADEAASRESELEALIARENFEAEGALQRSRAIAQRRSKNAAPTDDTPDSARTTPAARKGRR